MPSHLLIITQKVDDSDDLLGFFVSWIRAFATHFDRVDVIALGVGTYELPPNVHIHSLGKERGVSKVRQWLRAAHLLWRHTPERGGVFAHMSPVFAILAWPFAQWRRSKLVLWYLHRSNTARLRLAVRLVDRVVTADAASLTVRSGKIVSVGHGIDIAKFLTVRDWSALPNRPLHILSVGRLSPIKDFATLIRSVALLRERDVSLEIRIVGRAVMSTDHTYARELQDLAARLGVQDIVHFVGFVPYRNIEHQYAWADIVVGCTPRGGLDKVLLEGMAAGCVVMTTNEIMTPYLGSYAQELVVSHGNAEALADAIACPRDWPTVSAVMVNAVRRQHNLEHATAMISALI